METNRLTPKFSVAHRRRYHCSHLLLPNSPAGCFNLNKLAMDSNRACFSQCAVEKSDTSPSHKRLPNTVQPPPQPPMVSPHSHNTA